MAQALAKTETTGNKKAFGSSKSGYGSGKEANRFSRKGFGGKRGYSGGKGGLGGKKGFSGGRGGRGR